MIQSKSDLKEYIRADRARYGKRRLPWFVLWLMREESVRVMSYLKLLRYLEYYTNVRTTIPLVGKLLRLILEFLHRRRSYVLQLHILPNVCGKGIRIVHLGGGIILNANKIGENCTVSAGVIIGKKGTNENRPYIGDNVNFSIGSKAIGRIVIGNNVTVAPNSVVIKDVPDNCVLSGVPARILKKDGQKVFSYGI